MKDVYDLDDLLDGYVQAVRPPSYGLEVFRTFARHRATCLARCFDVSFGNELCWMLDRIAYFPDPLDGTLEAGLVEEKFEYELAALRGAGAALRAFYRERAREIARRHWGDVGTRTHEQLLATGFDPAQAPKLDDYLDQI